jgi:hypothetical protein
LFSLNNSKTTYFEATAERSDTRINTVLSNAGVFSKPGQRVLGTGVANLGTAPVDETASVLEYILRINNSEQGRIWVDGSGNFHFDRRLLGELQSVDASLSDTGGTAIPFTTFDIVSN